jgi:acetyl esterase/lipase
VEREDVPVPHAEPPPAEQTLPTRFWERAALFLGFLSVLAACSASSPSSSVPAETSSAAPSSTPYAPAPAGAFPEDLVAGLQTEVDVPFTGLVDCGRGECAIPLDVLAPIDGSALPTIVAIPGGPGNFAYRRYMDLLVTELARQGAVVFLATYRTEASGSSLREAPMDVRCAIRYARSITGEYGGDPETLVLVGHSLGSNLVIQTAINPEADTPGCLAEGDGVPEAVVGLSSFQFSLADAADSGPPLWLVAGELDPASAGGRGGAQRLRDAGFEVDFRELADTGHTEIVEPALTPAVVDVIFEAVALTGHR